MRKGVRSESLEMCRVQQYKPKRLRNGSPRKLVVPKIKRNRIESFFHENISLKINRGGGAFEILSKFFIVFHNEDVSNLSQHFQVVARNKFFRKKHIFQHLEYLQTRGFFAYVLKRCRRQNFLLPLYIYSMVVTDTVVGHVSYFIILHRGLSIFLNFFYLFVSYIFHTISTI